MLEFSRKTSRKNKEKHKKPKALIFCKIGAFLILKEKNFLVEQDLKSLDFETKIKYKKYF